MSCQVPGPTGIAQTSVGEVVIGMAGWLGPATLDGPPEDFNAATGWVWLPAAETS